VPRRSPDAGDPPEIAWFNDFNDSGANFVHARFNYRYMQTEIYLNDPV
jgi:hypothetical protein